MASSWVDYANLGLNATNVALNTAQLSALNEANFQLTQLSQLEADRERRRQYENTLRQFVFEMEMKLSDLVNASTATPAGKWLGAMIIKQNVDSVSVSAASFQEFVDKDRVTILHRRLSETIEKYQRLLVGNQLTEARHLLKILNERSALAEYIAAVEAQEFLDQSQAEWERMKEASVISTRDTVLSIVFFSAGLSPFMCIAAGMSSQYPPSLWWLILVGLAASLLISIFGIGAGCILVLRAMPPVRRAAKEYNELTAKRHAASMRIPTDEHLQALRQLFGADVRSVDLLRYQELCERSLVAFVGNL